MSLNPLSLLFDVPVRLDLPIEERKNFAVVSSAGVLGFLAHIVFIILFFIFKSHFMMYLNIGSLLLFASVFYFNRTAYRNSTFLLNLASVEILIHATCAILVVGWKPNFHIYFFIPILASLVTSGQKTFRTYIFNALCVVIYILLAIYSNYEEAIAPLPEAGTFTFQLLNIVSVSSITIIVTMYYSYVVNTSSKDLVFANQSLKEQSNKIKSFNNELAQQTEALQIQSEQLEHSNRHITDSIKYALRLQEAILPSAKNLNNFFGEKNVMVFYSPKDIVSGDFYWAKETFSKEKIVAVADCTGHGVPGAMLTMIGENLLNNIILEKDITEPALILDALQGYFSTLFTNNENIQDGMDISIAKVSIETKKLHFAGARNSLVYIQDNQLYSIQGDKMSIGNSKIKSKSFDSFTPHQIDISTPTTFYLFTDGYQDQFGGLENRKFYSKNLKELFLSIHQLPMSKQRTRLKMTFVDWCNFTSQTDDVTILGVKVDTNEELTTTALTETELV